MRILLVGATGVIGSAILASLKDRHQILAASRSSSALSVDLGSPDSIRKLFDRLGKVDAIIGAAGSARFKPFASLNDEDYDFSLRNKLMGQVNLIRYGMPALNDGGSVTITTGLLAQHPVVGSAAVSLVNAALDAFVRAASLEAPRGIRVNAVSPGWIRQLSAGEQSSSPAGLLPEQVALAYGALLDGDQSGQIIVP